MPVNLTTLLSASATKSKFFVDVPYLYERNTVKFTLSAASLIAHTVPSLLSTTFTQSRRTMLSMFSRTFAMLLLNVMNCIFSLTFIVRLTIFAYSMNLVALSNFSLIVSRLFVSSRPFSLRVNVRTSPCADLNAATRFSPSRLKPSRSLFTSLKVLSSQDASSILLSAILNVLPSTLIYWLSSLTRTKLKGLETVKLGALVSVMFCL